MFPNIQIKGYSVTIKNKRAGEDWLTIFFSRTPEPTSLQRQRILIQPQCLYFLKLKVVRDKYGFDAVSICYLDEIGATTVQKMNKGIVQKRVKQVEGITSTERFTLVTVCVAVSASGNSVSPIFVFLRKEYQDHFVRIGPVDSIGAANGSGWMTENVFFAFI